MADFTEVDLYRSCRVEQFPNGLVLETNEPAPGLPDCRTIQGPAKLIHTEKKWPTLMD